MTDPDLKQLCGHIIEAARRKMNYPVTYGQVNEMAQRLHAILSVDVGGEVVAAVKLAHEFYPHHCLGYVPDEKEGRKFAKALISADALLRAAMANQRPPPEGCEWVAVCKTCWCDPEHAGRCRDRECPLRASPGRGK